MRVIISVSPYLMSRRQESIPSVGSQCRARESFDNAIVDLDSRVAVQLGQGIVTPMGVIIFPIGMSYDRYPVLIESLRTFCRSAAGVTVSVASMCSKCEILALTSIAGTRIMFVRS